MTSVDTSQPLALLSTPLSSIASFATGLVRGPIVHLGSPLIFPLVFIYPITEL
jgi:hypothetical protein